MTGVFLAQLLVLRTLRDLWSFFKMVRGNIVFSVLSEVFISFMKKSHKGEVCFMYSPFFTSNDSDIITTYRFILISLNRIKYFVCLPVVIQIHHTVY